MDATELVSGIMLLMYRVFQTTRTSQRLSEIPHLPVYAQKRFRPQCCVFVTFNRPVNVIF